MHPNSSLPAGAMLPARSPFTGKSKSWKSVLVRFKPSGNLPSGSLIHKSWISAPVEAASADTMNWPASCDPFLRALLAMTDVPG